MALIAFTIFMKPVAWQRVSRGAHGQAYVPEKTRRYEKELGMRAKAYAPSHLFDGPLMLTAKFILPKPQRSKFKNYPAVKPDLDNLIKALKDSLNGIIWTDDSRICIYGKETGKYYAMDGSPSRIEIQIEELV